jgi:Leucine-rich repeat (LRR) protein
MKFNIINYLNSLPEDIECIDLRSRNLTFIPSLKRFKNLKELNCSFNKLTSLPSLNENLRELNCSYNQLTSLPCLNEKLKYLNCMSNQLTSLPSLNENLQTLHCSSNKLTLLPSLNENLQSLYCCNNHLTSLPYLNKNLQLLDCSSNQLTSLPSLNENLQTLYCLFNHLTSLPYLNEKMQIFCCDFNPIREIIDIIVDVEMETIYVDICKKQIQTLNNFRHLYWCLKFKRQFKKWLWEKIREPKIIKQYHPSYLFEKLQEDTDLNTFLDNLL